MTVSGIIVIEEYACQRIMRLVSGNYYVKGSDLWLIIQVNDSDRITEIWLSNADQQEQELDLRSLYKEYKSKGYLVSVYMSGKGDLLEYTKDLVCHNYVGRAQ